MIEFQGDLIVGGNFTTAGGVSAPHVARRRGAWDSMGPGLPEPVTSLAAVGRDLFAAVGERSVYRWDGVTWSVLDSLPFTEEVYSVASFGDKLYALGHGRTSEDPFHWAYVARWEAERWHIVLDGEEGIPIPEYCCPAPIVLGVHENRLVLGSQSFTAHLGLVGAYDGVTWSSLNLRGEGIEELALPVIYTFGTWRGRLVAGGWFSSGPTHMRTHALSVWDGTQWLPLGTGIGSPYDMEFEIFMEGSVGAIAEYQGSLYVGGDFSVAGGKRSQGIARWDGN